MADDLADDMALFLGHGATDDGTAPFAHEQVWIDLFADCVGSAE